MKKIKNEGLTNNENCSVFDKQVKDIEASREKFNKIMKDKLTQDKENAGVKEVKTSNIDELTKRGKEMRTKLGIKESKNVTREERAKRVHERLHKLHEAENTTSKCTLENGEKCLATRGRTSLIKTEDGKYVTKYAPGYKNGEIEAKNDKEAINKFLNEASEVKSSRPHHSMMDIAKENKLTESPIDNLEPRYDSRKSFYGKAKVNTDYPRKGSKVLYSYGTPVVGIRDGEVTLLTNGYLGWASSQTTLRHVKDFLRQEGFKSGTNRELGSMYPTQSFEDWKNHVEIKEAKESEFDKKHLTGRVLKKKDTIESIEESKQLVEGYIGQTLRDFLDVSVEPDMNIQQIVLCDINEDEFDDSICFNGKYEELTETEFNYEFHEFDTFGEGVTINVGVDSGDEYYSTVSDFLEDCNEDIITIFDLDKGEVVFEGDKYEIPDEVLDMEFASFDAPKKITINVTCSDEDYEDDIEDFDSYDEDDSFDSIDESLKITSDISEFKPWSGAVETFEKIKDAGRIDDLDFLLEDIYPDGITETQLNDILWFDADWVLESLGLKEEEFEDEDID